MWSLIRGLLVAGNLFFLAATSNVLWQELTTSRDRASDDLFLALAIVVLISLNLYFLIFRTVKGNDWLSLWMKRKRLEEEKRIRDLEGRPDVLKSPRHTVAADVTGDPAMTDNKGAAKQG